MKKALLVLLTSSVFGATTQIPKELFIKYLPNNPIILEAGAQFGEDTSWMAELWPQGIIYAFEPLPKNFEALNTLAQNFKNINCFNLALSTSRGEAFFYEAGGASSLLKPTESFNNAYFHSDLLNPLKVQTTTVDEWAEQQNIDHIDFMWLDMEGNELNVLKSTKLLNTVKLIYLEVNLQKFWENCALHDDVKKYLVSEGFLEIWTEITPQWQGNALYLKTR